ncbi:acyltransferase family protein [Micromonospora lupini]|uniref:Acyltransferase mdmB n=1 Tax=Micromonospora lupini str. Lupac 08 TaxID=1150864 RepID=I0L0C3_9ACTN|nr:acyltransferase [Micromonospora lupini]CCH17270.1 Acyltransferase mdmB [Micromonospora lupini str. Lupac 08]
MTSTTDAPAAPPAPTVARLPSLTGLRWIAALLVFGFHAGTMRIIAEPDYKAVIDALFTLGLSGVQFFFILSGFVLVWSARPGGSRLTFWRRRIAKIYPNHLVLFAATLGVAWWFADPVLPAAAVENLLLLQAWDPRPGWFYSINTVSWSLSCEFFFYLCLPLALPLLRRARPSVLWTLIIALPLLILALWPAQHLVPEVSRWWFTQIFPPARSLEFWLGAVAAELMLRGLWRGPRLTAATAIFVVTWVTAAQWIPAQWWTTLLAVAYLLVITAAADADVSGRRSPWRSRPLVWLGEVSFAFYLVHVLVMTSVLRYSGDWGTGFRGWRGPAVVLGFLLVNLVLAGLLHRFVETPMMRRLAPRRPRRPPVVPRQRAGDTDTAVGGSAQAAVADARGAEAGSAPTDAGGGSGRTDERSSYVDLR